MNITPLQSHSVCVWEPWDTRGDSQTADDQKIELRFENWDLKSRDKRIIPLQRNPVSPIARHSQWVRGLHGLRTLLHGGRRRAPGMSLPSFLLFREFSGVLSFFVVFSLRWFFYLSRKGEGRKAVSFLNSGIPFPHFLWPSWKYVECFLSKPRAFSCSSTI